MGEPKIWNLPRSGQNVMLGGVGSKGQATVGVERVSRPRGLTCGGMCGWVQRAWLEINPGSLGGACQPLGGVIPS